MEGHIPFPFSTHPPAATYSHLLLFLHLVGSRKFIKEFPVHLHEGLEDIVDQRNNGPGEKAKQSQKGM